MIKFPNLTLIIVKIFVFLLPASLSSFDVFLYNFSNNNLNFSSKLSFLNHDTSVLVKTFISYTTMKFELKLYYENNNEIPLLTPLDDNTFVKKGEIYPKNFGVFTRFFLKFENFYPQLLLNYSSLTLIKSYQELSVGLGFMLDMHETRLQSSLVLNLSEPLDTFFHIGVGKSFGEHFVNLTLENYSLSTEGLLIYLRSRILVFRIEEYSITLSFEWKQSTSAEVFLPYTLSSEIRFSKNLVIGYEISLGNGIVGNGIYITYFLNL